MLDAAAERLELAEDVPLLHPSERVLIAQYAAAATSIGLISGPDTSIDRLGGCATPRLLEYGTWYRRATELCRATLARAAERGTTYMKQ